tara:strand:+ start:2025 stop:3251 length:1227 start_codon:yes stop_codon:yes gene_type:complete
MELLKRFENKKPEIVFEWHDEYTYAKGWLVINSLRGGGAAGGTRMRLGITKEEVLALAKTMEIKFSVSGPNIGGGKSGINFDPRDERKRGVLKRWFKAVKPMLKSYYGTGGDMNIDEVEEVIPYCKEINIEFPLEGVINGHFSNNSTNKKLLLNQLSKGIPTIVNSKDLSPNIESNYSIGDLITGYGVAESVIHYYNIYGGKLHEKRIIIQGWGNVAGATAFYLSKMGGKIVGIIDKNGGILDKTGLSHNKITELLSSRKSNFLIDKEIIPFNLVNQRIWSIGAEIFVPCAASRLVKLEHLNQMIANDLEVISSGANVPFDDNEIFYGPICQRADEKVSVIPDFISNCGMARAFSYFMQENVDMQPKSVFQSVSETIKNSLLESYYENKEKTNIYKTALEIALKKLLK